MNNTRKLVYTALLAALTAAGAFMRIPMGYSSVTLQYLFTAMAGLLLGRKWGALSQLIYVCLGLVGLPIFTMGGGFGYVFQPTFGFLLGLIPAAWVVGAAAGESLDPRRMALASLAGLAVLYAVGMPYMALILNVYMGKGMTLSALLWAGMLPYLPGDAVKIIVAAGVCPVAAISRVNELVQYEQKHFCVSAAELEQTCIAFWRSAPYNRQDKSRGGTCHDLQDCCEKADGRSFCFCF